MIQIPEDAYGVFDGLFAAPNREGLLNKLEILHARQDCTIKIMASSEAGDEFILQWVNHETGKPFMWGKLVYDNDTKTWGSHT